MQHSLLLSRKLRNAVSREWDGAELEFDLKNWNVNGCKTGCHGFVSNPINGSCVYVDTESPVMQGLGYMYRYADGTHDFKGYGNRWAQTQDLLVSGICECLRVPVSETRDHRI